MPPSSRPRGASGGAGTQPVQPAAPEVRRSQVEWDAAGNPTGGADPAVPRPRPASVGPPRSLAGIADRVGARLDGLLRREQARWGAVDEALHEPLEALRLLVAGDGKRLRPAFCHWAYVGAGGDPDDERVADAAAAIELLHTFALVHDDVMDGSEVRRGQPSVHRRFIDLHAERGWGGESRRFGEGAAILVGDFAFVYADALMRGSGPEAWGIFDELRLELCVGQYLDLATTAARRADLERARRIELYKSGKYTVERPLHLGAALAGRLDDLEVALSRVGLPLGEAFQLRDDVLGTFGDAGQLGKPVGADLRDGKLTPLVAVAWARADDRQREALARIGTPDLAESEIDTARRVVVETGALARAERRIAELLDEALAAVDAAPIASGAAHELAELARFVAWRDR